MAIWFHAWILVVFPSTTNRVTTPLLCCQKPKKAQYTLCLPCKIKWADAQEILKGLAPSHSTCNLSFRFHWLAVEHFGYSFQNIFIYIISLHLVLWEWVHFFYPYASITSSHYYYYGSYLSRELAGFWPRANFSDSDLQTSTHLILTKIHREKYIIVSLFSFPEKTEEERDEFSW